MQFTRFAIVFNAKHKHIFVVHQAYCTSLTSLLKSAAIEVRFAFSQLNVKLLVELSRTSPFPLLPKWKLHHCNQQNTAKPNVKRISYVRLFRVGFQFRHHSLLISTLLFAFGMFAYNLQCITRQIHSNIIVLSRITSVMRSCLSLLACF